MRTFVLVKQVTGVVNTCGDVENCMPICMRVAPQGVSIRTFVLVKQVK
jgi:hypothetical protein